MVLANIRLDIKILKEACVDLPEARKEKNFIKNRRIIIVLSCYFSYYIHDIHVRLLYAYFIYEK